MNEENHINHQQEDHLTIGAYLKQMREKKKLTVKIISQHTKINSTKLELLEADRLSELPNQAYVVGYVKSYSKTLGLDQQYCLKLLSQAYGKNLETIPQQQLQRLSETDKPRVEATSEHSLGKIVAAVAAVAVVVGILAYLSQKEQSQTSTSVTESPAQVESEPEVLAETPVEVVSVAADTKLAPAPVEEEVEVAPALEAPAVEVPAVTPVVTPPVKKVEVSEEDKKQTFRPIVGPTYTVTTISAQEKELIYPAGLRSSGQNGEYHVYIKAVSDDTWITYKTDDEDPRRFVLQKDRHVILRGKVHRIFLGNANATKIFVNQELIEMETRTGVKSLVVPNQVRTQFALPLFIYPGDGRVLTSDEVMAAQDS